jgi:hypothetical protein
MVLSKTLTLKSSWSSYLKTTKYPAVVEEHLPFTVQHHLRRPQASRTAGHA